MKKLFSKSPVWGRCKRRWEKTLNLHPACGLTLTDVVTTVFVFGILASVLLPALSKTGDKNAEALCRENLKQCWTALRLYAQDANGYLPPAYSGTAPKWREWPALMGHYIKDLNIIVCPGYAPYKEYKWRQCYGLRYMGANVSAGHLESIWDPKNYIVLADSICKLPKGKLQQWYFIHHPGNSAHCIHTRHSEKANMLFADGSVRALDKSEILALNDGWKANAIYP